MKKFFGTLIAFYWGISAMAQVGIGTATPSMSSVLDINSSNSGLLIPRVNLTGYNDTTTIANGNVVSLMIYNTNSTMGQGYYYWSGSIWVKLLGTGDSKDYTAQNGLTQKGTQFTLGGDLLAPTVITTTPDFTLAFAGLSKNNVQSQTQTVLAIGTDNVVKALKATLPKFFYMPSIIIPTHTDQLQVGEILGTINLYTRYQNQFGTPMSRNSTANTSLPVLPKNELDYYITWFDTNVFDSVQVTDEGVLTYSIKANADVTIASFMNIVFAVKP
jgi:hypothetical protein